MKQWRYESENVHKRNQFCIQYLSQTCITNNRTCTHCHNTGSRRRIYPQRLKPYPTTQGIPSHFRHSKDQYCVYNSLPLNSTPSQWTPVHTHTHILTTKCRSKASITYATHYSNPGSRYYTSNWLFRVRYKIFCMLFLPCLFLHFA